MTARYGPVYFSIRESIQYDFTLSSLYIVDLNNSLIKLVFCTVVIQRIIGGVTCIV